MRGHICRSLDGGVVGQILARCVETEFVIGQLAPMQPSFSRLRQTHGDVGFAAGEVEFARHRHEFDGEIRVAIAEGAEPWRQEFCSKTVRRADAYRAGGLRLRVADRLCCRGRELIHLLRHLEQPLTGLGERGAAGAAVEQLGAKRCFQRGDTPTECRIIDLQPLRRRRHAAGARDGQKRSNKIPVKLVGHRSCSQSSPAKLGTLCRPVLGNP